MCDHESIRTLMGNLTTEDLAPAIREHNRVTPDEMAYFVRNELKAYLEYYESDDPDDIFQFLSHLKWCLLACTRDPQNYQFVNQDDELLEINFDELEAYVLCEAILRAFIKVRALSI